MARPYQRMTGSDLELLYTQATDDFAKLKKIEGELQMRSVPTALRLLEKVQLQMNRIAQGQLSQLLPTDLITPAKVTSLDLPKAAVPRQVSLGLELPGFHSAQTMVDPDVPVLMANATPNRQAEPDAKGASHEAQAKPAPPFAELTAEQSYRLLRATPSTSWAEIEGYRRELVGKAQPDKIALLQPTQRRAIQEEARRANAAYKVLSHLRAKE